MNESVLIKIENLDRDNNIKLLVKNVTKDTIKSQIKLLKNLNQI